MHNQNEGIVWIDIRYYKCDETMILSFYAIDCSDEMEIAVFKNVNEEFAIATDEKLGNLVQDFIIYDDEYSGL